MLQVFNIDIFINSIYIAYSCPSPFCIPHLQQIPRGRDGSRGKKNRQGESHCIGRLQDRAYIPRRNPGNVSWNGADSQVYTSEMLPSSAHFAGKKPPGVWEGVYLQVASCWAIAIFCTFSLEMPWRGILQVGVPCVGCKFDSGQWLAGHGSLRAQAQMGVFSYSGAWRGLQDLNPVIATHKVLNPLPMKCPLLRSLLQPPGGFITFFPLDPKPFFST